MDARLPLRVDSRTAFLLVSLLSFGMGAVPAPSDAAKGDCAQPTSTGSLPMASDCLTILKVAVGIGSCSPECICAPKGTLPAKASDALLCLRKAVGQDVALNCPCGTGDDFNDNSKDADLWGQDLNFGNGRLSEAGQTLRYTCSTGTSEDESIRPWVASELPWNANWEVRVDVTNLTSPTADNQVDSAGLILVDAANDMSQVWAELYVSHMGGPPTRSGFYAELDNDDMFVAEADTGVPGTTHAAVRVAFNASTKVVTLSYDADVANGYAWVPYASFGLDGSGGANGNTDWGLGATDRMAVGLYGYSERMTVAAGSMSLDNFTVIGGVAP